LRAASGSQNYDGELDARFMTLQNGSRFIVRPGQAVGERLHFANLQQRMLQPEEFDPRKLKEDTLSTSLLLDELAKPGYMATLQWRLSLIILVPLVAMLAVAMSRTTPRQGRYIKLLPAMLMYFAYMTALDVLRHKITENDWPAMPGLLVAHVLFLIIALLFLYSEQLNSWRRSL
jgi:lipopolysaccharide export system permease protein